MFITEGYANSEGIFLHSYRAAWYYRSFICSPTDPLVSCLKKN